MSHDKKKAKKVVGQAQMVVETINPVKGSGESKSEGKNLVSDSNSSLKGQSKSKKR
jgi:hypothetical protein